MLRRFAISGLMLVLALPLMARTRPHYGGTLRVEIAGNPWQGPDGLARQLILDGLTALDAHGAVRPALAASWKSDDNGHRWQFRLRPGVQFQDGSPLTATAVVMSLNLACASNCPWTAVHAVGESVVFTADHPVPQLPTLLAGDAFLIALTRSADGQPPAALIGTGAFQFTSFNNNTLTLAANESCWQGRPFVDQIVITAYRAIRDQWLDLSLGRADVAEVPAEQLRQAQQQRLTVVRSAPVLLLALRLSDSGALSNSVLRAVIAHAVDRSALFNVIFQKQGEVTASLLPQSLTGYSFLFPADRDLNKANELRGGLSLPALTMAASGDGTMQLAAQRIALNLREAGIAVQPNSNPAHADLVLCRLPLQGADAAGVLANLLFSASQSAPAPGPDVQALFRTERNVLDASTIVPLLDLPRAYAVGDRVRDFALRADGTPDLAAASLEDAP